MSEANLKCQGGRWPKGVGAHRAAHDFAWVLALWVNNLASNSLFLILRLQYARFTPVSWMSARSCWPERGMIGSCMKVQSNTLSWRPGNAVCAPGLHTALVTRKLVKSSYRLKTERSALGAWSDPLLGSSPDGVLNWSCFSSWTCVNSWFLRSATSGNQCNIRCLIIMHLLSSCVPDIGNRKSESYH